MARRAVLYARVSSDDRGKDGRNLEGQLEMCREHAQTRGYTVIAELAEDDRGAQGSSLDLEKLGEVRELAHAGEIDIVIVREIDRFARSLAKQLIVEEELRQAGVAIEYVLGEYPDTPEGNLNKNIKAVIAEYEAMKIAERTARARRQFVKAGNVLCHGQPPYGYRITEEENQRTLEDPEAEAKNNGRRTLGIYEPEADIVRLIFEWYTGEEHKPIRVITQELTALGIPTPSQSMRTTSKHKHATHWNSAFVSNVLGRELYAGTWRYGKHKKENGHYARVPTDETLSVEVPGIVSRDVWEKARRRKMQNRRNARRNTKYEFLLGRRATCGECGYKIRSRGVKRTNTTTLYYYCHTPHTPEKGGDRTCTMTQYFRADQIDAVAWEWLKRELSDPEQLIRALREYSEAKDIEKSPLRHRLEIVAGLIADNREKLERILDLYVAGEFDKDLLIERRSRLEGTLAELEREQATLQASMHSHALTEEQIQTIFDLAEAVHAGTAWAEEEFSRQRELIELLNVRATLAVEDDEKVIYLSCEVLDTEESVSLVSTDTRSHRHNAQPPIVLTTRIKLGPVPHRKSA